MAHTNSADSASTDGCCAAFHGDKVVNSFPRHDIVKLDDGTFVQWRQQVRLILGGYGLLGFVDGTLSPPSRFLASPDGSLVPSSAAQVFDQQDQFLTSWLLSTVSSSCLASFTDARSACDVWTTAARLFAADTGVKQSRIRHELHSLTKGALSIKEYVAKITTLCALLAAFGTRISDEEKTQVMLAGLPSDFDAVVSSASLSSEPVPFQRLVDALLECETRQLRAVQEVVMHANLVEGGPSPTPEASVRGGTPLMSGRGRCFRPRIQCQICNRLGHLAQKCYYRFRRDFDGSQAEARATNTAHALGGSRSVPFAPQRGFDGDVGGPSAQRMRFTHSFGQNQNDFGQNQHAFRPHYDFGQNWTPAGYYGGPMHNAYVGQNSALDGHVPRPELSRPNLAYVSHEPSRSFAPYNGLRAGNAGGQLNDYRLVNNCVQVGYPLSFEPTLVMGVIIRPHLFLGERSRELVSIVVPIRVLVFLGLVIYMRLIFRVLLIHMLILLRLVLMVVKMMAIFPYLLGLLLGTRIRELAIMYVAMRRLFKVLLRISETLLKGHIQDGLYQFLLPDVSRPTVSVPVAASIEV
ncbi:uncharacterized protein [Gossypium hirsutum]|uniref:Uncharacterized protein isoform X2 n=1 Tax=Gossypium hirsutum TaxID=3635 RepID=A0A1U8HPV2_GOSHI|nr:uncharacterized protein LOC107888457 isoform X2 [Gossypium hirsutum]